MNPHPAPKSTIAPENQILNLPELIMPTALEKLRKLDEERSALREEALSELRAKLSEAQNAVRSIESEIEELTGVPATPAAAAVKTRTRRQFTALSPEETSGAVLKFLTGKKEGASGKEIAEAVGVNPLKLAPVLAGEVAKKGAKITRTGVKRSTRYFLK